MLLFGQPRIGASRTAGRISKVKNNSGGLHGYQVHSTVMALRTPVYSNAPKGTRTPDFLCVREEHLKYNKPFMQQTLIVFLDYCYSLAQDHVIAVLRVRPTNLALALATGPVENRTPTIAMGVLWVTRTTVIIHAPDHNGKIVEDTAAIQRRRQISHLAG